MPKLATAKVNFRLAPGDSLEDVRDHLVKVIDDPRVKVKMPEQKGFANPASRISSPDSDGFKHIKASIYSAFGDQVVVAPGSTTGGTDVRNYAEVSDDQYRFAPLTLNKSRNDTERIHGVNERISVEEYDQAVVFYAELLNRAAQ